MKTKPRDSVLLPLMKSTYHTRRLYIRDGANSARDILEKYKALSRPAMVSAIIRVALVGVITLEYNMH